LRTFVATKNAGKLREMREIFAGSPFELETYEGYRDVDETADTYEGNALLKARALHEQLRAAGTDAVVLADDSGLEVYALDGRPGIYSARYGGTDIAWPQRRALLLAELSGLEPQRRGARFVSALALLEAGGRERVVRGTVEGRIAESEIGDCGFGYDPVFYYPPRDRTFAQLAPLEKNALSHRRRAAEALLRGWRPNG
jgi:XTP/dITP diphosphohydrolase